ncbi:MAG: PaaI family thioesterase [Acidimicrobiales bacterium]
MALQIPPNCDLTLGLTCLEKGTDATTVWRMRVDERFLNPAGIVQGGFLSAMMDSAMGASAVLSVKDRKVYVANTEMKSSFLRPVRTGDVLTCTASVLKPGSVVAFLQAQIHDDAGTLVATASSTYLIKERGE